MASMAVEINTRKRVVVLGGGFGGIHTALGLAKMGVDVTLVDRKNHHTFSTRWRSLYSLRRISLNPSAPSCASTKTSTS